MGTVGFLAGSVVKNLPVIQGMQVPSLGWDGPLEEPWQPSPVLLPGESYGQRSLAGYSPWGRKELGATEAIERGLMRTLAQETAQVTLKDSSKEAVGEANT